MNQNGRIFIDTSTTPHKGVEIADLQQVLGIGSGDLGYIISRGGAMEKINKWAGLIAGAIQGLLWVLFAVSVLELLIASGLIEALTPALVEDTLLVSWLSGINPFGSVLKDFLMMG